MKWLARWNWSGYSMHRVDRARYLSIECLRGALLLLALPALTHPPKPLARAIRATALYPSLCAFLAAMRFGPATH